MRAAYYEKTGEARDVLIVGELPTPNPAPGEVRVRVAASGVNPSDVKARSGRRNPVMAFPRITPHSDGAGVIDAVGAGVDAQRVGQRVWLWNAAWRRPNGSAAEYVVLPAEQAVALPDNVDMAVGACLGIPALTAYHAVTVDGGITGRRVLVAGGAGSVGQYAIQFARLCGAAQVITTVSSDDKADIAWACGADEVINYRTEHVAERTLELTDGRGVDRIVEVDCAGNIGIDIQSLRPDGDLVVYGTHNENVPIPFFTIIQKNLRLRFVMVYTLAPEVRTRAIEHLNVLLARGALRHCIAARLPLSRIIDAHEQVEGGKLIGNLVLEID